MQASFSTSKAAPQLRLRKRFNCWAPNLPFQIGLNSLRVSRPPRKHKSLLQAKRHVSSFLSSTSLAACNPEPKRSPVRCAVNPFDLRGPEFLLFYFFLSLLVIGGVVLLRRSDEDRDIGKPPIDDPYLVAFLRGRENETLRVATLSLVDRGLLTLKSSGTPLLSLVAADSRLELTDPA